jgi:AraC family transcriptional regulator of adaptative response / DNA-3-methyladenine glycosylase II
VVATADLTAIGLTRARAAAIRDLGAAIAADPNLLRPRDTLEETIDNLLRLPGVGPWTAQYIAMRALGESDAFPASDLGILRALSTADGRPSPVQSLAAANAWRPWRAYAAMRLWIQTAVPLTM